ncbi:MAG TPA: RluA family pseudouridine synthase [Pedomonas sp.]|uniref:RluA family pseudouridine synthase n=1 Tax=Pedomonas sp. TaxID=2976421 RepID=UPI002F42627E
MQKALNRAGRGNTRRKGQQSGRPYNRVGNRAPEGRGGATLDDVESRVLYIDAHLIVLNKPAGLAVHRGPKTPYSLEDWLPLLTFGFQRLPQPAHRLDRDTSGCLVLGRHPKAIRQLGLLFAEKAVKKTYWAVVEGHLPANEGTIEAPLRKISSKEAGWRMIAAADGETAVTHYRVLGKSQRRSWLELVPETGRTHQLRVHCATLGHPIAGDLQYGDGLTSGASMMLHAREVSLKLSEASKPVTVTAPPPPGMADALKACGWAGDEEQAEDMSDA